MPNVEQQIKDSLEKMEVKTTAEEIMNQYHKETAKKPSFHWSRKWYMSFAIMAALVVLVPVLIWKLTPSSQPFSYENVSQVLTDDNVVNTLSIQLLCGKSFDHDQTTRSSISLIQRKEKEEDEEDDDEMDFTSVVDHFDPVSKTVTNLLDNQGGITTYFNEVAFNYQGETYQYVLTSGSDAIYLNENITEQTQTKTNVLVFLNENYYQGHLEYKINEKKLKMELSYYRGNTLVTIQKETRNQKFELSYSEKTGDKEIEYEIELEYEYGEMVCEYEYESDLQEFEIMVRLEDSKTYLIQGEGIKDIILTITSEGRIYTCDNKIIKK